MSQRLKNSPSIRLESKNILLIVGSILFLSMIVTGLFRPRRISAETQVETLAQATSVEEEILSSTDFEAKEFSEEVEIASEEVGEFSQTDVALPGPEPEPMSTEQIASAVQWGSVNMQIASSSGQLSWSTLMEINRSHFEIERSLDGKKFHVIDELIPEEQVEAGDYDYLDQSLAMIGMPRIHYRVRQIGLDGNTFLSPQATFDLPLELGVYARIESKQQDKLVVRYATDQAQEVEFRILDAAGRLVSQQQLEGNRDSRVASFDAQNWKAGTYLLLMDNQRDEYKEQFVWK